MGSDNPSGADNQQGSPSHPPCGGGVIPQRLNAELLAVGAKGLEAYLQGALCDGTQSTLHNTHRFCQSNVGWLDVLSESLTILGYRSWKYREGRNRNLWVLETTAPFLSKSFNARALVSEPQGLDYVRGYFDSDGGMPSRFDARLYFQFCQKDRESLGVVKSILEQRSIDCGRVHNPSKQVDADYWRVYVLSGSHERFMRLVGSWHPKKRTQLEHRMKI
jgi:hypothetical protein